MSELPLGWAEFNLKDLGGTQGGKTPSKSVSAYWSDGTIPWTSPKDMKSFLLKDSEDKISEIAVKSGGMKLLPKNSVLFVTRSGILAHTFPVALTAIETAINQDIKAVTPNEVTLPKYLAYLLKGMQREILDNCSKDGTTVASIETELLEKKVFPLAPRAEQKRIVEKLDALLARVDATRARLDRIPELLKRFRQSVLAAATSGQLTEDWRQEQLAKASAQPVAPVHHGSDSDLPPSKGQVESMPTGWAYERAADVCAKVQSGGTPKEGFTESGIPFLKVYNIVNQLVSFEYKPQYIDVAIHNGSMSKSQVQPGDVLMNIVGPPLGKVAVVPATYKAWNINQAITLFRPSERVSTGWLYCILCGGENIADILHETRGSAGQTNISLSQCRDFIFPIPPVVEQKEIVRRVEYLFGLADKLEAHYTAARAKVDKLTPALLAKAFRGELVTQDPNDEPAEQLLTRIRVARESSSTKTPRKARTVRSE